MPSIFCLQDDQDQVRHRTESCSVWFPLWLIVCGDKILLCTFDLVWTLLLFVPEKAWLPLRPFHWPQSAKCVVAFVPCARKPPNLFKCEVRSPSFLFPKDSCLQFAGRSNVQVARVYEKDSFETLYKQVLWNIHESPWLMMPTLAALVCPETCDTMAEDTWTLPVTFPLTLRQMRYIQAVLKQTCQRITQVVQVWNEKSFLSFV